MDLGHRRYGRLAAAAAGALFNRDSRGNAEDRIHIRFTRRLNNRPRVGIERLQVASLPFIK